MILILYLEYLANPKIGTNLFHNSSAITLAVKLKNTMIDIELYNSACNRRILTFRMREKYVTVNLLSFHIVF